MADGDVKYRFMADAASAERAIAALEKKYDQLEQKIKGVARESKKSSKEGADALGQVSEALSGLVGRYGTVAAAGAAVTTMYSDWRKEIDAATEAQDKFGRKLVESLNLSGDLARGKQIQDRLQNMPGVTQETAATAFFGVRGGAPSMGFERSMDVANQVAGTQGFIFRDAPAKLEEFGQLAGKLAELAPDKPAQDINDLASAVSAAAGRNVSGLTSQGTIKGVGKMLEGGKTIEEALALAVRGLDVGMSSKSLSNIKAEDMALMDPAKVAALQQQFGKAQTDDLAFRNLEAAAGLAPDDLVSFRAQATLQKRLRGAAEEREMVDAQFSSAESGAGSVERIGLRQIGRRAEGFHAFARDMLGFEDEPGATPAATFVNEESTKILGEILSELKTGNDQNRNNRPPIRRDAQTE